MLYIVLRIVFYPFFKLLSFFYPPSSKSLIVQTAKIGDYINATIAISALGKCDVLICKINEPFAKRDERVERYFLIEEFKGSFFSKLGLAFLLLKNRYENTYVLSSSSLNLYIAALAMPKKKSMLKSYATKWYEEVLGFGFEKIEHSKEDLTLCSYLKLVGVEPNLQKYKKSPFEPLFVPQKKLIGDISRAAFGLKETLCSDGSKNEISGQPIVSDCAKRVAESRFAFRIGISISAGNKIKNIPPHIWAKLLEMLDLEGASIYVFGLKSDERFLAPILEAFVPKKAQIISLLGVLELEELPYHLSLLDLHISSDSGNAYIADCYDVPQIWFSGPCSFVEQRPVCEKSLFVRSNAPCVPYSFVFKTSHEVRCDGLFEMYNKQESEIGLFISSLYRQALTFKTVESAHRQI